MSSYRVAFHRPYLVGSEARHAVRALESDHWDGEGAATAACEQLLERELGVVRTLLTTSCTHALELAALLLELSPGDEVIIPSFTFVSTANAFALRGARLVFCDVRSDTLCLDESQLDRLMTSRTRAVVPVHYAGVGCAMDSICAVAQAHGVGVIEDNAHGLFGSYNGRSLGTFGSLATLSFHATKNITCGEGGALLINDDALVDRAEMIRQKGTDRVKFLAGKVDRYSWQVLGSSYVLSEILAEVLLAQLEARSEIAAKRTAVWQRYSDGLAGWAATEDVTLPVVPEGCVQPAHILPMLLPSAQDRTNLIGYLARRGIQATFHYTPLHTSTMGRKVGDAPLGAPVTEDVAARIVRLPLYTDLNVSDQDAVIDAVTSFRCGRSAGAT